MLLLWLCMQRYRGPLQQPACLCGSSRLWAKIYSCPTSHTADWALSSSAWVTANDQLHSSFSGFCVKWHTERSVVNGAYRALFALHQTQPPTSPESGRYQLLMDCILLVLQLKTNFRIHFPSRLFDAYTKTKVLCSNCCFNQVEIGFQGRWWVETLKM